MLYPHAKFGGDLPQHGGERGKMGVFRLFLPAGQPPLLKLLRCPIFRFLHHRGDTIHGLTWNLARRRLGRYFGISGQKTRKFAKNFQSCKLFRPAGANPLPDFTEIYTLYALILSTQRVKIWCNLVHKWQICRQITLMGHFPRFLEPPSSETTDWTQRHGTDMLYPHAKISKIITSFNYVSIKSSLFSPIHSRESASSSFSPRVYASTRASDASTRVSVNRQW